MCHMKRRMHVLASLSRVLPAQWRSHTAHTIPLHMKFLLLDYPLTCVPPLINVFSIDTPCILLLIWHTCILLLMLQDSL